MLKKLLSNFKTKKEDHPFSTFIDNLSKIYEHAPSDFGGGCSYQKALTLAFFIKEFELKKSVDIGVYRGRSLFPQSISHRDYTNGIAYAIDPYDSDAAIQKDRPEIRTQLDDFAGSTDFNKIFNDVNNLVKKFDLATQTKFIRSKSHEASEFFRENNIKVGLVHIDGNHDTHFVMQDVNDYYPLLEKNGVIVLDDISWDSVKPAYDYLKEVMLFVGECIDTNNDFAVFVKKGNDEQAGLAKKLFNEILDHRIESKIS